MKKILAIILTLIGLAFGAVSYWLFELTKGGYAFGKADHSWLYGISPSQGWYIFLGDLVIAILVFWVAYRLFQHSRRQITG